MDTPRNKLVWSNSLFYVIMNKWQFVSFNALITIVKMKVCLGNLRKKYKFTVEIYQKVRQILIRKATI